MSSVLRSIHDRSSLYAFACLSLPFFLDVDALDCRSHPMGLRYDPAHQFLGQALASGPLEFIDSWNLRCGVLTTHSERTLLKKQAYD